MGGTLLISGRGGGEREEAPLVPPPSPESPAPPPPHTQDIHTHTHSHTVAAGHAHPAPAASAYTRRWRHSPELLQRAPATLGAAERRPGPGRGPESGKQEQPQRRPATRGDGAFSLIPLFQYLEFQHPSNPPPREKPGERDSGSRHTHAGGRTLRGALT